MSSPSAALGSAASALLGGPLVFSSAFSGGSTVLAGVLALALIAILTFEFRRVPAAMMLACLAVCALPGFFYAADRPGSWTGLFLLEASILVFLLVLWSLKSRGALQHWTLLVVAAGAALAALGPLLFTYESKGRVLKSWEGLGWLAETVDPNVLSGVTAMIIPLALASLLVAVGKMRGCAVVGAVLLLAGLIVSESIAGCVAAFVSCALWLAWTGRQKDAARLLLVVGSGVLLAIVLFPSWSYLLLSSVVSSRMQLWGRALCLVQEFAFTGVGSGSFGIAANRLHPFLLSSPDQVFAHAHNLFLEVGVTMGIAGFTAFVVFVGLCVSGTARLVKSRAEPGAAENQLMLGYLCGLIAHLVHGLVDSPLWMNKPMPLLFLFLAVLASRQIPSPGPGWQGFRALGGWALLTLAGLIAVSYSPLGAMALVLVVGVGLSWFVLKRR